MPGQGRFNSARAAMVAGAIVGCLLLIPALAFAHLERPSYWPDPNAEKVDGKNVGGEVPKALSLKSALKAKGKSKLHVVCQGKKGKTSLDLLKDSIKDAKKGWQLRPSQPEEKLSGKQAKKLTETNKKLAKKCKFDSVQDAVNAADNFDRIVVMPGRYTEPKSRKAPLNDPKCNPSMLQETQSGALAPSYEYQAECPNDQNLIHIQGRAVKGEPIVPAAPRPPRDPRAGARRVHPLRPPARGLGGQAGGRDLRRRQRLRESRRPRCAPRRRHLVRGVQHQRRGQPLLRQARRPAHRPHRWLRRPQLPDARARTSTASTPRRATASSSTG